MLSKTGHINSSKTSKSIENAENVNMPKTRYSKQRQLILDILKSRFDHPTADMVYATALNSCPNISLGTVYRNLKLLVDEGIIDTLETVDKRLHYDGDTSNHIHFVCSKCGKIIDYFEDIAVPTKIKNNNKVTLSKCVFYGLCKDCDK